MKESFDNSILISRITSMCNVRGTSVNRMLLESKAGTSTVDNLKKGSAPAVYKLVKIADYLETSIDYLLGRIDKPDMTINVNQKGRNIVSSPINAVNNAEKTRSEMTTELIRIFETMSFTDKIKIMNFVIELNESKTKNSPKSSEDKKG